MNFKLRFLLVPLVSVPLLGLTPVPNNEVFIEGEYRGVFPNQQHSFDYRIVRRGHIGHVVLRSAGKDVQTLYIDTKADACLLSTADTTQAPKVLKPCSEAKTPLFTDTLFIWRTLDLSDFLTKLRMGGEKSARANGLGVEDKEPSNMPEGVTAKAAEIYNLHLQALRKAIGELKSVGAKKHLGETVQGTRWQGLATGGEVWATSDGIALELMMSSTQHEALPENRRGMLKQWRVKQFSRTVPSSWKPPHIKPELLEALQKPDTVKVKVVGEQFQWRYQYHDSCIEQVTPTATIVEQPNDKPQASNRYDYLPRPPGKPKDISLVVPVGRKIELQVTSTDVIHAWWVPEFGVKVDAVPGMENERFVTINKPGMYRGVCAELCGRNHGFHAIQVLVLPEKEYEQWFKEKEAACQSKQS